MAFKMQMQNKEGFAMVFNEVNTPFTSYTTPLPELRGGEALVEVMYTTICSSDLHTFYGRRNSPAPSILGHEIMGKLVAVGPGGVQDHNGSDLHINDIITWAVYACDHSSKMAQRGIPQKSPDLFKYGHEKLNDGKGSLSGGFATHCHLRAGTAIFRLPPELSPKEAAPLNCTHATVAGAIRLAGSLMDKNVLIIGAGMLGLSACTMSREAGAAKVWAMDISAERQQRALEFGADAVLHAELGIVEVAGLVRQAGGIDVVIETSGAPSAIEKGLELLNIGGIAVWVGAVFPQRDLAVNAEKIVRNILTIKGLHNYTPTDLATAIEFVAAHRHKYPFEQLVARDFPLTQLDQAFEAAVQEGHYRVGIYPEH